MGRPSGPRASPQALPCKPDTDFKPVVKLLTPDAQCTWLLTESGNDDIAYGVCDLFAVRRHVCFLQAGDQSRPQRQHHCPYGAGLSPMH